MRVARPLPAASRAALGLVAIAGAMVAGGCHGGAGPRTEIVVRVRSAIAPPPPSVQITVFRDSEHHEQLGQSTCACTGSGAGCRALPLEVGVGPDAAGAALDRFIPVAVTRFVVFATGFQDDRCATRLIESSATVDLVADRQLLLDVDFQPACRFVSCGTFDLTCSGPNEQCVGNARPSLPTYEGPAAPGSGTPDGGA